jgi:hypothetical protein
MDIGINLTYYKNIKVHYINVVYVCIHVFGNVPD